MASAPLDAVLFAYLNPDLLLPSVEATVAYVASNAAAIAGRWSNLDAVPRNFDDRVFISDSKNTIDVSGTNEAIRQALLVEGETPEDILRNSTYLNTIYRTVHLRDSNAFVVNLPGDSAPLYLSPSKLRVGDSVHILKNGAQSQYGTVTSVDSNSFTLTRDGGGAFTDSNATYLLAGIRLYDPLRLARVQYLDLFRQSNAAPVDSLSVVDADFNYELYTMLYPDTRLLNREQAYMDYVGRKDNQDVRIARTVDLSGSSSTGSNGGAGPLTHVSTLKVDNLLNLDFRNTSNSGRVNFNGVDLYYTTTDDVRKASQIPPYFDGLITERAIKSYVDRPFNTTMTLCNLTVCNNSLFAGDVTVQGAVHMHAFDVSNLSVERLQVRDYLNVDTLEEITACNATISNLYVVEQFDVPNLYVTHAGYMPQLYVSDTATAPQVLSGRVGIFDATASAAPLPQPQSQSSNAVYDNLHVSQTLSVGAFVEVGDVTTASATSSATLMRVHGIVEAANINSTSDERLKTNVVELDPADMLNVAERLQPTSFQYRHRQGEQRLGFIAQQLQDVVPTAVTTMQAYSVPIKRSMQIHTDMDTSTTTASLTAHGLTPGMVVSIAQARTEALSTHTIASVADPDTFTLDPPLAGCAHTCTCTLDHVAYRDVKVVDHQQLLAVLVGSIQCLSARVSDLEQQTQTQKRMGCLPL